MSDFLSKLENFLFDILGLILPGAIFLLILMSPILFVEMVKMTAPADDMPVIISALKMVSDTLKSYCSAYPRSVLTVAIILAYLTGHTVKVFSIIVYDFLAAIFDDSLNKIARVFYWTKDRVFPTGRPRSNFFLWLKKAWQPFKTVIGNFFIFKPANYSDNREILTKYNGEMIDSRLAIDYPKDAISIGKISGIITNMDGLKTLGTFFLAKYNLYRSLSLIFLFTTGYYIYFFKVASLYIAQGPSRISTMILVTPAIFWFTFHVKFKRYWKLFGQERIVSLFYILNKKKLNEG